MEPGGVTGYSENRPPQIRALNLGPFFMTKQWLSDSRKLLTSELDYCAKQVEETYKIVVNDRTPENIEAYQAACDYQTSVETVLTAVDWWQPEPADETALAAVAGP